MKKIASLLLSGILLLSCSSCKKKPDMEPQISQMRAICELAVMDCYYHNVAKFKDEDARRFLLWTKDKHFWIEYTGIVSLGIDASMMSMDIADDTVTITIPNVKVLNCSLDSSSLTKDSFIVAKNSVDPTAEDEQEALVEAQGWMEESASNDQALLDSAQQRVQMLLENYVNNIGSAVGKTYAIQWKFVEEP